MEPEAALVGAQRRVELHAEAPVDVEVLLVVLPHDAEVDDALGDGDDLEGGAVLGVLDEEGRVLESAGKLCGFRVLVSRSFSSSPGSLIYGFFSSLFALRGMCSWRCCHTVVSLLELGLGGKNGHFD